MTKYLTEAEQQELFYTINNNPKMAPKAREVLITSCIPLAMNLAKKFKFTYPSFELDDLFGEACIALVKAVNGWDISKGKITTIAYHYILRHLIDTIRSSKYRNNINSNMTIAAQRDLSKIREAGENSPIKELAAKTGLREKRIKLLLSIYSSKRVKMPKEEYEESFIEDDSYTRKPCLGDLLDLVDERIDSEKDREIFKMYLTFICKDNKMRLTANALGLPLDEVKDSISKNKKVLKESAHAQVLC